MRGPYSEYAAPPIYVYPAGPKRGVRFGRQELRELAIAILALSAAFTVLNARFNPSLLGENPGLFLGVYFPAALLAVGTGVGVHEVMHKVVAQRFGHWAEFRYNPRGLLMAFLFAAIGFLYGAPGATWISGPVTREQNGQISAAGPLSNILIAAILFFVFALIPMPGGALLVFYVLQAAYVNAILAGFNLIPIMPLDGAKIWAWNKAVYAGLVAIAILLIVLTFGVFL